MPARGRVAFLVLALLVPAVVHAEPAPAPIPAKAPDKVEHRVNFRADRVELTPDAGSLDLAGNVVVESHRFRLTSDDAVKLSRTSRGVHVDGKGELALCSCPKPPVTFGFGAADLAPPTDVLLQNATLRLGPVPVFWSPYLWLRSPTRLGMLPPSLSYRGEEGILLGTGLHVPLGAHEGARSAFDLGVGGYVRGGARVDATLRAASGRSALGFDYFRGEALDVSSHHAFVLRGDAVLSERIDWLSGERALVAPAELSRVAQSSDRLRLALGRTREGTFGLSFAADAPRDATMTELGWFGPGITLARGGALGARADYAIGLATRSFHTPAGAAVVARAAGGLSASAALGAARYEVRWRDQLELVALPDGHAGDLRTELRSRLGLPLGRRYDTLVHTVEPFSEAALVAGSRAEDAGAAAFSDLEAPPRALIGLVGVDTALGAPARRSAAELSVAGGALAEDEARAAGVLAARARVDVGVARAAVDARWLPSQSASEISARAEARTEAGVRVGLRVASAVRHVGAAAGLWGDDFARPKGGVLRASGVSAGGRLGVPWGGRILTEVGADVDISEKRWLSSSAALGYRHVCRCLSLLGSASRRLGRNGFDVGVSVEIVPR